MSFDLLIAFDKAEYLNPQLYMMIDTLKDNIPEETILHVVTNRDKHDKIINYILDTFPDGKSIIYHNDGNKTNHLKSRCKYMFNCFDIQTDKEWVIKLEADLIVLKHLDIFNEILKSEYDLVIEPENRKIHSDIIATKLWRLIYNHLDIKQPKDKIVFREDNEEGLPLYGTGLVCVKSKHLKTINNRWVPLTKICENWIGFNIHPNEFAFTAMAYDEGWNTYLYPPKYKFNPIGHFRKGDYPSIELIDDCKLPDETIVFDYHRPQWLMHVAKYNPEIHNIIKRNKKYIPNEWWELTNMEFQEK